MSTDPTFYLRGWRLRAGLTQAELATKANLQRTTVVDLEAGRHPPRPSSVRALAQALDVPSEALYLDPGAPETGPLLLDIALHMNAVRQPVNTANRRRKVLQPKVPRRGGNG